MRRFRAPLIWAALALLLAVPVALAAGSPLLEWRRPIYIAAGLAGVVALCLTLLQPLLAAGLLPGLPLRPGRQAHRAVGVLLVASVILHVAGLWVTSPPDMVDALLFRAPTLFSAFGVIAMWALFGAACLAAFRRPLRQRLPYRTWRLAHTCLAVTVVVGSVAHAALIVGTMETVSKLVLCAAALLATGWAVAELRGWRGRTRRG